MLAIVIRINLTLNPGNDDYVINKPFVIFIISHHMAHGLLTTQSPNDTFTLNIISATNAQDDKRIRILFLYFSYDTSSHIL
jgi:hypothetical protein